MPGTARRRAAAIALAGLLVSAATACSSADDGAQPGLSPAPSSPAAQPSSGPAASPTASANPSVRTVSITVSGKQVTPAPGRVKIAPGETLRLVVTADRDNELHAHGFEVEQELKAGVPKTVDLSTSAPGLYEVELHHPELRLLQVQVG
jgi:plastocyanin